MNFRIENYKMINESFESMDTPNKKRKRDNLSRFVSSTPIKLANKENFLFSDSLCMEHKSIADIVAERNAAKQPKVNEFEVIRKPPKKKKKTLEDFSFVNPGLDLKVEEKAINPFEVVRSDNTEAISLAQGFSNAGLEDVDVSEPVPSSVKAPTNPFEVIRETEPVREVAGIDNTALELNPPPHVPLMLPVPFTPSVNLRIDFSNMPDNLTPSGLLTTKLVLENKDNAAVLGTPKRNTTVTARKSLSVISEEEVELDIKEELDNYQLQLENSINEAKMQNRKYVFDAPKTILEEPEDSETEAQAEPGKVDVSVVNNATYTKESSRVAETSTKEILSGLKESDVDEERFIDETNEDVQFEEVDSFDDDFGTLGQFQRAYRTDAPAVFKKPAMKPQVDSLPKKSNLGGSIRRSIRKLINKSDKSSEPTENEKHEGLFQTIRHSLRRKPKPKTIPANLDCSVLESRTVFRETSNDDGGSKKTIERATLKRHVVKTMKTFMESVEEFDHY